MKTTLTMHISPNLRAKLNLERKYPQLGLNTWHFHLLQEVLEEHIIKLNSSNYQNKKKNAFKLSSITNR
jgi:hypothetical protein